MTLAVLLAGCGSSGSSKPNATPTAPQTSTTTVRTVPDTPAQRAADKTLARGAGLRLSDLPSGYVVETNSGGSSGPGDDVPHAVLVRFATCAGIPARYAKALLGKGTGPDLPSVDSPTFDSNNTGLTKQSFMSSVVVAHSPLDVEPILMLVERANRRGCWKPFIVAALNSGKPATGSFTHVTIEPSPLRVRADQFAGINSSVEISVGFISVRAQIDLLFARRGRAVVMLFGGGIGEPIDRNLERTLLETVLDRVDVAGA